ncbi:helicase [Calothrix sp. FACHB-1219]|uniref:helicase-related protein n=1 Tax=unclassified Calothrix TaxID=2619626 RepID=UPI001683621D|nr:helicase-related protein [Calothrix sp. FACHB-168]MBD2202688.1 helicase [Calothrix sp. FACHB-168]MBD2218841.1 helicase [Calothrix sp. FACHB-1219]
MLEAVIQELIRKQRPYFLVQGSPIKGVDNQYWLIFKHRDADNFLHNIVSFLGIGGKNATHKLLRIDLKKAKVFEYTPRIAGDLPSVALLRTSRLRIIEKFLNQESVTKEKTLLAGSFQEIKGRRRKFNLPAELDKYNTFISNILERSQIYRRSTAYFDSGILKLYQEPLAAIVQTEGQIRLLMDWQGFTKQTDIAELEKLHDPNYRIQFAHRTLAEFLQGLEENAFTGTEILAELVRLGFLYIKLVKMEPTHAIYHKKTGILSDILDNHILHEGSDNFTRAAHSRNAESVTFLYSWESNMDAETISESIQQFDTEWQQSTSFDLSPEFLQQVLLEKERRTKLRQPVIESITPDEIPPGETTPVEISGQNLDKVEDITVPDDELVKVIITSQQPERIIGQVEVDPDHPPTPLKEFKVKTSTGIYNTTPNKPVTVTSSQTIPDFTEIAGFQQSVEIILQGQNGTPEDFLYWLAQQRPRQFRVERSDQLDQFVNQETLFEHQKSGAQHCLRVMQDFGVTVCADAVGLGKTRLAAAVTRLYREQHSQARIAIIAAKKLFPNWEREMAELGFNSGDYELYNKNLMSRKGNNFLADFNRYGGADLVIIDEAHEGIRNYKNRIHKICLEIREKDLKAKRQRYFLLLTATPWNNRREDIYNILSPFLSRPQGFNDLGFPPEVALWFQNRETGVENFTDDTDIFRRTYRELFLQRTRQMLRDATPDLNLYAKRVAEWLPVEFETSTEQALDQIFTQFETSLFIPFADPIRYLRGRVEQRSLLRNQRRFFLQRAESSMYALRRTIKNFGDRIRKMQEQLEAVSPDADGLKEFLLLHYGFESDKKIDIDFLDIDDREIWDEDYEEEEEDENEENSAEQQQKRQQLRRSIDIATDALRNNSQEAQAIHNRMLADCAGDLNQLQQIQNLLADEFVKDHKREQVTQKVRQLVSLGHKVLLISTFSDTVIDYYRYMAADVEIATKGIGMAIGSTKRYYPNNSEQQLQVTPYNILRGSSQKTGLKRQQIFRLFAPAATCKNATERPNQEEEIAILIGSETLSVGQNLQDADYLINIDLPWNPMILEQRIGRIDRPKQHKCQNISIYYANSESQLLRQASRLSNLNKKLVGDIVSADGEIPSISSVDTLGASIYGDTLFDDEVLPGYIDFLNSLVKARRMEQGNLQEETYQKQETNRDLYTQNEILHSEELSKLIEKLGEDYQAKPIALGRRTGEKSEPTGLVALTVEYFGPNGEPIPQQKQTVYWNDQTGERDGYGLAIANAFKTPEAGDVFSSKYLLSELQKLYNQLVTLKKQRSAELAQPETLENINITSERITRIQRRVSMLDSFPSGLDRTNVRNTFKKLNTWKETKGVQKLLREYTDGEKSKLDDATFVVSLVQDTDILNLIASEGIKPTSLKVSLAALLLRA